METESPDAEPVADPDPEIAALLDFTPVHRRIRRHDGWPPGVQRAFIAHLARMGSAEHAAYAVGRSAAGAWKLRGDGGGQSFADAWDGAIDLWHRRNPDRSRRGGRARGAWAEPPEPDPEPDPEAEWNQLTEGILFPYMNKLAAERQARLGGRIVEADFLVRQLTWLEVTLDLAGLGPRVADLLMGLKLGDLEARRIAATPMSVLLGDLRRACWARWGEPERPAPAPLGRHDGERSTGEIPHWEYDPAAGTHADWLAREERKARFHAEAQAAWEEKARADAEEWARSTESKANDA